MGIAESLKRTFFKKTQFKEGKLQNNDFPPKKIEKKDLQGNESCLQNWILKNSANNTKKDIKIEE